MNKLLTFFLFLFFLTSFSKTYANFNIKARTVILQDFLSGKILYEMRGVSEAIARSSMRIAAYKMPVKTKFLIREGFVAE